MATRRSFNNAFKRMVVEEYLSGTTTQAQLSRRYNLSHNMISRWRDDYASSNLSREKEFDVLARDARIRELERMVGKLTMENELLKKAAEFTEQQQRESSSIITGPNLSRYKRGAK